jgi:DNA-directed RNA polymerase subunit RPC12/RpoP
MARNPHRIPRLPHQLRPRKPAVYIDCIDCGKRIRRTQGIQIRCKSCARAFSISRRMVSNVMPSFLALAEISLRARDQALALIRREYLADVMRGGAAHYECVARMWQKLTGEEIPLQNPVLRIYRSADPDAPPVEERPIRPSS